MKNFNILPYQDSLSSKHIKTLKKKKILYLVFQQRVGKTITSFLTVDKYVDKYKHKSKKVLFVTDKKTIPDIKGDIKLLKTVRDLSIEIDIINFDMLHKINKDNDYHFFIIDEAQGIGAYPQPNLRAKELKRLVKDNLLILLSATPSPESYSQLYHQFWISEYSPFKEYLNFYHWVKAGFVTPTSIRITGRFIPSYDQANYHKIKPYIKKLMVTYTRKKAGFKHKDPIDVIKIVPIDPKVNKIIKKVLKDRYYKFKKSKCEVIVDTAVSLQQKLHQLYSGTIICTHKKKHDVKIVDGVEVKIPKRIYKILDESKAEYIKENYSDKKIAIYYKFKSELEILKKHFKCTEDPQLFNTYKDLVFVTQFRSGSRGINIKTAEIIIAYNIDFSYEIYSQFRQRLSNINKETRSEIHWLFSEGGIEQKIYPVVLSKETYTVNYFKKDFKFD